MSLFLAFLIIMIAWVALIKSILAGSTEFEPVTSAVLAPLQISVCAL